MKKNIAGNYSLNQELRAAVGDVNSTYIAFGIPYVLVFLRKDEFLCDIAAMN